MSALTPYAAPEGLPFERRPEDTDRGWALYLQWVEADGDLSLARFADSLSLAEREIALTEGAMNEWTRRKMAFYRYSAEMMSCQAASKAAKSSLKVIQKWDKILDKLTADLDEDSRNFTDAEIERLRVVGEGVERILKAMTGNKFVMALQVNNNLFGRRQTEGPPVLAAGWDNDVIDGN